MASPAHNEKEERSAYGDDMETGMLRAARFASVVNRGIPQKRPMRLGVHNVGV